MKKLILILSILTSSYSTYAEEGVYLKGTMGMNHINNGKYENGVNTGKLKLKRYFPVVGLGVGYQFDNNLRIETMIDYYFLFSQTETKNINDIQFKLNLDTKISDLVFNIYKSFPINEYTSVFAGGGIGIASIQDEGTGYFIDEGMVGIIEPSYSRHVYRFTHRISTGVEFKIKKSIYAEISYNYLMLGKNKPQKIDGINGVPKRQFNIHNLTLGLRFLL